MDFGVWLATLIHVLSEVGQWICVHRDGEWVCVCMAERDGEGRERKSIPDAFVVHHIQWDILQHARLNKTRHHLCPKLIIMVSSFCTVFMMLSYLLLELPFFRHIIALQRQFHGHANQWICPNMNLLAERTPHKLSQWPQYQLVWSISLKLTESQRS